MDEHRERAIKPLQTKDIWKLEPLPMWGRVWGYPLRRDFHRNKFWLFPRGTTMSNINGNAAQQAGGERQ
jgi:hypothetical protein